ncbi:MAG TPA: YigZ family protein [Methylophilaceae bacterium]|nr:YigZ family protein [Methylophilaceae bacterium]HAJ71262.1 YigZ family protein [Methylophilaceae bacterium]
MRTLSQTGQADQTINKSRFIAIATSCETEREVAMFLRAFASKHPTAHHLAYAYRIKTADGVISRFSDAGEPSGAAGKPILQILDGQNLINLAVAVIRYYGGVNLGTGGLVKAYGGTAKLALEHAGLMPYVEMQEIRITTSYKRVDELTRDVAKLKGHILDKVFDNEAHFIVKLPALAVPQFIHRFQT